MRLTFIGADHEVTGSCHFLEACGLNILIDCGMEQGINKYENAELPIPYSDVELCVGDSTPISIMWDCFRLSMRGDSADRLWRRARPAICVISC